MFPSIHCGIQVNNGQKHTYDDEHYHPTNSQQHDRFDQSDHHVQAALNFLIHTIRDLHQDLIQSIGLFGYANHGHHLRGDQAARRQGL